MSTAFNTDNRTVTARDVVDDRWLTRLSVGQIIVDVVANGMTARPGRERAFEAYRYFRELVYIDEAGIIDLTEGEAATDFDGDDDRSVHIAAIERTAEGGRIVGSMRVILRGREAPLALRGTGLAISEAPLPVQIEFPEAIEQVVDLDDASISCELSRYISRHENKSSKLMISGGLHRVAVATVVNNDIPATFAIVEKWLDRILRMSRVPLTRLSEPRLIARYGSENYAVRIHMFALAESYGAVEPVVVLDAARARAS